MAISDETWSEIDKVVDEVLDLSLDLKANVMKFGYLEL